MNTVDPAEPITRAGIGLGSNQGARLRNLRQAWRPLVARAPVRAPLLCSSIYETEPVDCPRGSPPYINAVAELGWAGNARALFDELLAIERGMGRRRSGTRNEARLIDLDLLYFGQEETRDPDLTLPHPRLASRRFVLEPLAEIRPDIRPGRNARPAIELLAALGSGGPWVRQVRGARLMG